MDLDADGEGFVEPETSQGFSGQQQQQQQQKQHNNDTRNKRPAHRQDDSGSSKRFRNNERGNGELQY